jgi:hypothetical protein
MIELNKRSQGAGSHLMSAKKNSARQFLSHRVSLAAPAAITILDVRALAIAPASYLGARILNGGRPVWVARQEATLYCMPPAHDIGRGGACGSCSYSGRVTWRVPAALVPFGTQQAANLSLARRRSAATASDGDGRSILYVDSPN